MKKIRPTYSFSEQEAITVNVDPNEMKQQIVMPEVEYKVIATAKPRVAFHGTVIMMPRVLIYFLTHKELVVMTFIMDQTAAHGACWTTVKEMESQLALSSTTISGVLYRLRLMGLLMEKPNGQSGSGRVRTPNFEAIQHLDDVLDGESTAVCTRMHVLCRDMNVMSLRKDDVQRVCNHKVLPKDHDPEEEEEYD